MLSSRKFIILGSLALVFITTGVGCKGGDPAAQRALAETVALTWWGVFDTSDLYGDVIHAYQVQHPNVKIHFKKVRYDEYEQALLSAQARGEGPDIFYVHNSWMGKYAEQLLPLPEKITLPVKEITGVIKKEEKASFQSSTTPSANAFKEAYVDVVWRDVFRDGTFLGFPVMLDTLVLYYNRQLLDQSGILTAPRTWKEIADAVTLLTRQDELGELVQSGIALGTGENVPRASDVLMLLMLQNGAEIFKLGRVAWDQPAQSDTAGYRPGPEALRFYTDFANLAKEVYTWNARMPGATEAFVQGRLAMMLGYAYQLPALQAQGPRIDIGVAPVPHINPDGTDALRRPVNLANYWIQGVSRQTEHPNEAWDFLLYLTRKEQVTNIVTQQKRPAARRDVLNEQLKDPDMAPFAQAALTSRGWYAGRNPIAAESVILDMIRDVLEGTSDPVKAAQFHAKRLEQTL